MIIERLPYIYRLVRYFYDHKYGYCNICGRQTIFLNISPWGKRNSYYCLYCKSISRERHIAKIVIDSYFKTKSLKDAVKSNNRIRIYSAAVNDAFYKILFYNYKDFYCSFYLDRNYKQNPPRMLFQDIQKLTYPDNFFDIVITQDVLEHVKNYKQAFFEIKRVLKKGGVHIFSIPFDFFNKTKHYYEEREQFDNKHIEGKVFHGKYLVYTEFGNDLLPYLENLGYVTKIHVSDNKMKKYGIFESYVFESKKI